MNEYFLVKWVHVLSSTVLLGTGAGIAFFFVRAQRSDNPTIIATVAADVVLADKLLTLPALLVQPLTGVWLAMHAGYSLLAPWVQGSVGLYVLIGGCWLPVVWLQLRMRDLAMEASRLGTTLPWQYRKYYRWWFALGWPAFVGVLAIAYLMVAKPGM